MWYPLYTHTHTGTYYMCVCIELLRNTASPQLVRQKKNYVCFQGIRSEFRWNAVRITPFVIDVVLLSHSVFFLFLLSLVFVPLSLLFSRIYLPLSISRVFLFLERNEKKQSSGARRETEGGRSGKRFNRRARDSNQPKPSKNHKRI